MVVVSGYLFVIGFGDGGGVVDGFMGGRWVVVIGFMVRRGVVVDGFAVKGSWGLEGLVVVALEWLVL